MAQIINKRSPEIIASRRALGINFLTVREKEIYFPKQVVHFLGIEKGKYIHFINDKDYWGFFVNTDPDGFEITFDKGFKICNRTLAAMFAKSIGKKGRFYILDTNTRQAGHKVYEVYTQETVEVVIDRQKRIAEQKRHVLAITPKRSAKIYNENNPKIRLK